MVPCYPVYRLCLAEQHAEQGLLAAEQQRAQVQADLEAALVKFERETSSERLQRGKLEQELAAAQQTVKQLHVRAKAAEQDAATAKGQQAAEAGVLRERTEHLRAELAECQEALQLAKAESGRRLKDLQALQRRAAANENSGINGTAAVAALEKERQCREAAEAQLREARQTLARKSALASGLRSKIGELERQVAERDPAPLAAAQQLCQDRVQKLQAACASKDASIKELRERLEQHGR